MWLGESGAPALDAVYVEHNGPLLAHGHAGSLAQCLRALLRRGRLVLPGVDDMHLAAARAAGAVRLLRSVPAPWLDLSRLGPGGRRSWPASAPTPATSSAAPTAPMRPQVPLGAAGRRRCQRLRWRRCTRRAGPRAVNPAPSPIRLSAFHRDLLARALPRGEAELLRVAAGEAVIGYLYNFRHRGRVLAYQSGFDYATAPPHVKPGLTCHHAAIALARREGMAAYDFLAGGDRYKTSLANAATTLHWLEVAPRWSPGGVFYRLALGKSNTFRCRSADRRPGRTPGPEFRRRSREDAACRSRPGRSRSIARRRARVPAQ